MWDWVVYWTSCFLKMEHYFCLKECLVDNYGQRLFEEMDGDINECGFGILYKETF